MEARGYPCVFQGNFDIATFNDALGVLYMLCF